MANTRTYVHDEHTLVDAKGNETVMFHKSTLKDVVTSEKSNVTAVGKVIFSAECTIAAATAAKVVSAPGYALVDGGHLTVKFTNGITCANATLNVNNTGAKAIKLNGANLPAGVVLANRQVLLKYNGASFDIVAGVDATFVSKANAKKIYFIGTDSDSLSGTPANEYYNTKVYVDATGDILTAPYVEADGSKLTNLNATQLKSGTVNAARLPDSGVTAASYGATKDATLGFGDVIKIPYITFDKYGRATAAKDISLTLPANPDTDVKVTSTAKTATAYYLSGTTSTATATGTLVHNTAVYVDTSNQLHAPTMQAATMYFGETTQYINGTSYTGKAATVNSISGHLEDGLASTSTTKAATANAARKLSAGITSLISQLGTQATFSLSGTTLTITTKTAPSVTLT